MSLTRTQNIEIKELEPTKIEGVNRVLNTEEPNEIYNLSGISSVGYSIMSPRDTYESIISTNINILENIRENKKEIRYFMAGSTECFGDTGKEVANENTRFDPLSPYASAKVAAYWQIKVYRSLYDIFCCTGILGNHESTIRRETFVTQKIIKGVQEIKKLKQKEIKLGNLDIQRDWGWAPEYVVAMNMMVKNEIPKDYIIATGKSIFAIAS